MKFGDIVMNGWDSLDNPHRKLIYIGKDKFLAKDFTICKFPNMVKQNFSIVGHIPLKEFIGEYLE